ncbi:MAG: ABC transporter permease [Dysgonomonas sp.]
MKLIWKLLRENISKAQLIGFFVANLAGLTIVLVAFQFYFDISPVFSSKEDFLRKDYLTITKKVGFMDTFSKKSTGFSDAEISDLKKERFVKDVGAFTSSRFNVYASISRNNTGFGTDMFFESVPDQFVDVKTEDWRFSPVDNVIPIILPKNYLDLYNFGFAASKDMPKLSENMIGMINLDVTIWGRGNRQQMKGRIVGFSNRLNTILVPETFMTWANENFGNTQVSESSRLMVEVNNIADPQISQYFKDKGYEVEGDNTAASRMSSLLKIMVAIVVSVGGVICILSFFILVLSIYLLLEKNMDKLHKLRLLGYKKLTVCKPYELLIVVMNGAILILSLVLVFAVKMKYESLVGKIWTGFQPVSIMPVIAIGLMIVVVLTLINVVIIRKKVK